MNNKTKCARLTAICLIVFTAFSQIAIAQGHNYDTEYKNELMQWVDKLAHAESGGNEKQKPILDTNNKYSYGCLMFQEQTFKSYAKKHNVKGDINDCDVQKELALRMLQSNTNTWRHWTCSVKGGESDICRSFGITKSGIGVPPVKTTYAVK